MFISAVKSNYNFDTVSVLKYLQVVYNANKLARLVAKKKSLKNRLVYYQNKYERHPKRLRPTTKVSVIT